jgi:hypothetical protein
LICGRYLLWRSVTVHWRSIPYDSIARTKSLENRHITDGAGDAVCILLDLVTGDHSPSRA